MKVLRHWPQRDQQKDVRAWLYRIATNIAYDELRRWRRRPCMTLPDTWDITDERSDKVYQSMPVRLGRPAARAYASSLR